MKKILSVIFTMAVACAQLCAWAVSFTVQAPRQVVVGNAFNVTFVLKDAKGTNFSVPDIKGATKLYGPALSTSYSSSWVNGKSSSSSSQEYTMTYKASSAGKYTVGGATIMVNGHKLATKPFTIEAVGEDRAEREERQRERARRNSVQYDDPLSQTADKNVNANDLFVRITMSKQHVYEQEAVVCTIKLYTKYQISQFMATLQPSFNGFLIEDLPLSPSLNKVERVNGQNYVVAELKKCILFPQQSGKLTITSGNYDVSAVQYETYSTPFGSIQQPVERKLKVKSNSATVYISPLPTPKPAGFNGAVGTFKVHTDVKPTGLKTYAASTYSYVVEGTGNIKYLKAPSVEFPKQFDVYDPKSTVKAGVVGSNVTGQVRFDYLFIPQYVGKFSIPASKFVYFDPNQRQYVTIDVPARNMQVGKGSGKPSGHYKEILQKNTDILHIKQGDLNVSKHHSYFVGSVLYWALLLLPLVVFVVILLYYRKMLKERSDVRLMRTKRASKLAQRRLKVARQCIAKNNRNDFYAEVLKATWGYLSDKLTIPVSELSKDNIQAELERYGVDVALRAQVSELLDKCEFAQYAPELANDDMQSTLAQAASVMDKLESVKRKKQ